MEKEEGTEEGRFAIKEEIKKDGGDLPLFKNGGIDLTFPIKAWNNDRVGS